MGAIPASGFDRLAPAYHDRWTGTHAGRIQREAVWRHITGLFPAGSSVLDLGCGTGDDALTLAGRGVRVTGIDASPEMVRIARSRGVDARICPIENVAEMGGKYDGMLSNFGVFNCVERLADLRKPLGRALRAGGWLAICQMNRYCLWETAWYALHGKPVKAIRRWGGEATSSVILRVFYPTIRTMRLALEPEFKLISVHGIGVAVPPAYVTGLSARAIARLGSIDKHVESIPILRSLGDHRLLIFRTAGK